MPEPRAAAATSDAEPGYTVLIVDDQQDALNVLQGVLELEYRVLCATSPEQALLLLAKEPIDLIISDHRMPGMTGVELLTRSMEIRPECIRIMLTGYADLQTALDAINRGAVYRFLQKPWDPRELLLVTKQGLEKLELGRKNRRLLEEIQTRNADLRRALRELNDTQEELLTSEKFALVGKLASDIIHDINNHLSCLLALERLELQQGRYPDQDWFSRVIQKVKKAKQEIRHMLEELRDFAKGRESAFAGDVRCLGQIIRDTLEFSSYDHLIRTRRVRFDSEIEARCRVDETQIKQLVLNLLRNAAKASKPRAEISIELSVEGGFARISVRDHGVGIAAEDLERIWDPFFTTDPKRGTGLGLGICRRIAERHGGSLSCVSQLGQGTTFTLALPLAGEADMPDAAQRSRSGSLG